MPLTMALKCHIPTTHVLNNRDMALVGRCRWWWPFFKKTKNLLQLIAINEIESILVLLLLYSYNPRRPPAALTCLLSTVDCRLSVSVAV